MTDHYLWEAITILVPIVLGAYISLRIQRKMKKEDTDETISRMKNAIKQEIQDNIKFIDDVDLEIIADEELDSKWDKADIQILTTAVYDSSIKSGNFLLLDNELQKTVSELYSYIEISNFHAEQIIKSQFIIPDDKSRFRKIMQRQLNTLGESQEIIISKGKIILKIL